MQTFLNITMSLDGFVAGPNQTLDDPLGQGGEQLHDWIVGLESWRQQPGLEGGETNPDAELVRGTTTYTFVDGVEEAIGQAREAAGDRDVQISGGASVAQQALNARLLDELHIHVAPQVLGGGVPLFESADPGTLELVRAVESPHVAHLMYRVR